MYLQLDWDLPGDFVIRVMVVDNHHNTRVIMFLCLSDKKYLADKMGNHKYWPSSVVTIQE